MTSTEPFLKRRHGSARMSFKDVPKRCRGVRALNTSSPLGRGSCAAPFSGTCMCQVGLGMRVPARTCTTI